MPGWMACYADRFSGNKKRPQLGGGLRPLKVICLGSDSIGAPIVSSTSRTAATASSGETPDGGSTERQEGAARGHGDRRGHWPTRASRCKSAPWNDPAQIKDVSDLTSRSASGPHADSHTTVSKQRYGGFSAGSAIRSQKFARHLGRTSPSLRAGLIFRYTQPSATENRTSSTADVIHRRDAGVCRAVGLRKRPR
jgi:hypothetical protein